ncbi:MAG TPA: hemolysin III family protein [Pseudogracilibacillus sp.]|nr:hemolysin III family protein [Pseudogracilibacillus sp.]
MSTRVFSKNEEIAHAITHGVGVLFSLIALYFLVAFSYVSGDTVLLISVVIFGVSMLFMYVSSTLVHSLPQGKWKNIFLIIDHAAIYIFIAGTYTPFALIILDGSLGWGLFTLVWSFAVIGIILKSFFVNKFVFVSTLFYILMGWLIVLVWGPLTESIQPKGLLLLVLGGIIYTIGAVFYIWKFIPFHHMIWHIFVLIGSVFHFFAILLYVI